ncbi:MAG: DNA primase, partial [Planctomycetes bacterium]|nr:DNA primase [Planctomycetota bacterium]
FVDDPKAKYERQADDKLRKKLQKEAEGIFAWMARGYGEYQRIGLRPPKKVLEHINEYRKDEDVIGRFIEAKCVMDDNSQVQARALYNAYTGWCSDTGHRAMSETRFGKDMKKRFESKKMTVRMYTGLDLK